MVNVRYVGAAKSQIMDTPYVFRFFGQLVALPDHLAEQVFAEKRLPVITPEEFDSLGITNDQLAEYRNFERHGEVSEDFAAKRAKAWDILHAKRIGAPVTDAPADQVPNTQQEND